MVMELQFRPGDRYLYRSVTRPHTAVEFVSMALDISSAARITEESAGRIAADRFRPEHYRHWRYNADGRELTVTFDWEKGRAAIDSDDKPWSMPIPEDALDKLVVLLALRLDLMRGVQRLSYPVADGGKLKTYAYQIGGRREIETPAGTWQAIEVTRTKDAAPPDYRLWLAPELSYLPLRVEREENGALYRMELNAMGESGDRSAR